MDSRFVKKVCNKFRDKSWRAKCSYIKYYDQLPIEDKSILLETQHGKGIFGNIFYILKYLANDVKYKEYTIYFSITKGRRTELENVLNSYSIKNVKIIEHSTKEYYKVMASAKYLFTDVTFLPFFMKKEGQVYVNTWHGTPLKALGRASLTDAHAIGNVQKNFVSADYLLFPNQHTKEVIIRDYMLENISRGSSLLAGYPRNEVFFNVERRKQIAQALGVENMRIYAYMPTYRGTSWDGKTENSAEILKKHLCELDNALLDNEIMYVNLHPLARQNVVFDDFKRLRRFPQGYETYDFLNLADVLVTDYSSVFFDYASTRNKIVLFPYDKEEYLADRGMYLSMDEFPFPQVMDVPTLIRELRSEKNYDDLSFLNTYCAFDNANASQKLCDYVLLNQETGIQEEKIPYNGKENVLIYAGNLAANGITTSLRSLLNSIDLNRRNYYFTFYTERIRNNTKNIASFPEGVNYFVTTGDVNLTFSERVIRTLFRRKKISAEMYMQSLKKRIHQGFERAFGNARFDTAIHFSGYESEEILCYSTFEGKKVIYVHSDMLREIETRGNQRRDVLTYAYQCFDHVAVVTEDMVLPTKKIAEGKGNIRIARNLIDYQTVLEKGNKPIRYDEYTKATVSEDELKRILSLDAEHFVSVGRFSPEKGHDRLVAAFQKYNHIHPDSYLLIIGGASLGKGYDVLWNQVKELGIEEKVILIQNVSNPFAIVKECDYFVLSSYYEGFGLVLAEADILGLRVASTDIPGPRGFMMKNKGMLVENSQEGIYIAMERLHSGEAKKMSVDYKEYNQEAVQEFEEIMLS